MSIEKDPTPDAKSKAAPADADAPAAAKSLLKLYAETQTGVRAYFTDADYDTEWSQWAPLVSDHITELRCAKGGCILAAERNDLTAFVRAQLQVVPFRVAPLRYAAEQRPFMLHDRLSVAWALLCRLALGLAAVRVPTAAEFAVANYELHCKVSAQSTIISHQSYRIAENERKIDKLAWGCQILAAGTLVYAICAARAIARMAGNK